MAEMKKKITLLLLCFLALSLFVGLFNVPSVHATGVQYIQEIVNGNFESLPLGTGWVLTSNAYGSASIITSNSHSPTHSLYIYVAGATITATQTLPVPIPVANIQGGALTFWLLVGSYASSGPWPYVQVNYADGTNTQLTALPTQWTLETVTLTSGKSVSSIEFVGPYATSEVIDDVSLTVLAPTLTTNPLNGGLVNIQSGTPPWAFAGYQYYNFNLTIPTASVYYTGSLAYALIMFTIPTTQGNCICATYWTATGGFYTYLSINNTNVASGAMLVNSGVNNTCSLGGFISSGYSVVFPIMFTSSCLDVYNPSSCISVTVIWAGTTSTYGEATYPNFFCLYVNGGFTANTYSARNAGALPGGSNPFSMFGYGNSTSGSAYYINQYYRNLQAIQFCPTVNGLAGENMFDVWGQISYSLGDGTFYNGLQFYMTASMVSYTGIFAGNVWINFTVNWYQNNALCQTNKVYMFYHDPVTSAGNPFNLQFWLDFWFSSENDSSVIAGRINAYEYPMTNTAPAWISWLSSSWGAKDDVAKDSSCSMPMTLPNGTVINSGLIQMVRVTLGIDVLLPGGNQHIVLNPFNTYTLTLGSYPIVGISTPAEEATVIPTVGNSGLLGALWSGLSSAFSLIGPWLWLAILGLWTVFVAFLNTIAGWIGAPNGFSNLLTWIASGWSWLASSFLYVITIIGAIFTFLISGIGAFIWTIGQALVSFAHVIVQIGSWITGGVTGVGNLWTTFGISTWLMLGILFYPLYLVILWDSKGLGAVIEQLTWIWGMLSWLANFFLQVIHTIIAVINAVIEAIPVVE
jgi:hypothetical protein